MKVLRAIISVAALLSGALVHAEQSGCRTTVDTDQTVCYQDVAMNGQFIRMEWPTDGMFYHRVQGANRGTVFYGSQARQDPLGGQGVINVKYLGRTAEGHLYREVWYMNGSLHRIKTAIIDDAGNILRRD